MHHLLAAFLLSFLSAYQHADAAPSPASLNADFALLSQNALDSSPKTSALLIAKAFTLTDAVEACAAFRETLLSVPVPPSPDSKKVDQDIHSIMSTLGLFSRFRKTMFWVDVEDNQGCSVISTNGRLQSVQCDSRLPVFCTAMNEDEEATQIEVTSKEVNYVGTRDVHSFRFLGIPYSAPTRRFSHSSVIPEPTSEDPDMIQTVNALRSKAGCLLKIGEISKDEDCLSLDIFTPYLPVNPARSKMMKPVLVWFEDDGYSKDGGNMVSRSDVVVVRVKSRLGALGYLTLNDGITNGNFGLGDKVTALQWIRAHIADFGGDPTLVTIQGEAQTITALLGAEKAWGLFIGAIIHGTQENTHDAIYSTAEENYHAYSKKVVDSSPCHDDSEEDAVKCLRNMPLKDFLQASEVSTNGIVQDGTYVTTSELRFDELGEMVRVHVMFGWENDGEKVDKAIVSEVNTDEEGRNDTGSERANIDIDLGFGPGQEVLMDSNSTHWSETNDRDRSSSCQYQIKAIKSSKTDLFPSVWAYTYNKKYENALYGTLAIPDSNEKAKSDLLLLAQNTADAIGAFARASNPNPSQGYLDARGYVYAVDKWLPLKAFGQPVDETSENNGWPVRVLDAPPRNTVFHAHTCVSQIK